MNDLKSCPVFCLYTTSRKLMNVYTKHLKKLDLTYTQYLVISCLHNRDECSVDDIGQVLFLDSGTLTPLLKRLESNNLIERHHSKEDERKRIIKLTNQGRELEKYLDPVRQEIRQKVGLSPDEIYQLKEILHKIIAADI